MTLPVKRLFERVLLEWKDSPRRKPLIVRGARQVGKTTSISRFGRERFEELVEVDLERNRSLHRVFEGDLDARRLLSELRVLLDRDIEPGRSLLFLDEIQACPRALMALRYFHEEVPDLHVIAAGSLLDFFLEDLSFPVGRVQVRELHPLCFAEFLWARGKDRAAEVVRSRPGSVPEAIHSMLLGEVRNYLFVGGMPEAVRVFAETDSFRDALEVQRELAHSFRQDFARYAPRNDPYCLDAVFSGVARATGQQVKYSRLADGWSTPTIKRALGLLTRARVAIDVRAAAGTGLPLGASVSRKRFKALMVDVGLLQQLRGLPMDYEFSKTDLMAIHEGTLAEQFVGQEMMVTQGPDLYFWARQARNSAAEVDYLAAVDGAVVPIEVKAGPAGRLRSMHRFLLEHPSTDRGWVFSTAPFADLPEQKLTFIPIYQAFGATAGEAG